ncbi:RabGAP/TBC [Atractiella rhizophila]|nr:RabGAP/TBC [Atractiella rhizophila]
MISLTESFANESDNNKIRLLYAKLDVEGVEGDGYEAGKERTREGRVLGLGKRKSGEMRGVKRKSSVAAFDAVDRWNKELEVLRRVDRYGFLSPNPSGSPDAPSQIEGGSTVSHRSQHGRLAVLPKAPYLRIPKLKDLQRAQQLHPPSSNSRPNSLASSKASSANIQTSASTVPSNATAETMKEIDRIAKWEKMLHVAGRGGAGRGGDVGRQKWTIAEEFKGFDDKTRKHTVKPKFRKRVYKGIPDRWRQAAWDAMIDLRLNNERDRRKSSLAEDNGVELARIYDDFVNRPSTHDIQIDLDVPRTITGNVFFHTRYGKGQRALFHVLHAFALHCGVCGYCQGMGPIAATLLCYFEPERAYLSLVRLHDFYELHWIFQPGFPGLIECFYVQERLVELLAPRITEAFATQMISTSAYATKWYITLFANTVSFKTQLRLWDVLFLEGPDMLVLIAVAIIIGFEEQFVSEDASFESILSMLSSFFVIEDEDSFLRWIRKLLQMKVLRAKMDEWRTEWKGFVESGEARNRMT